MKPIVNPYSATSYLESSTYVLQDVTAPPQPTDLQIDHSTVMLFPIPEPSVMGLLGLGGLSLYLARCNAIGKFQFNMLQANKNIETTRYAARFWRQRLFPVTAYAERSIHG